MDCVFERLSAEHRAPVMDIFNHYVENSFAAYPETPLPAPAFDMFLKMTEGYPAYAVKAQGRVVGFGMLRAWHPLPVFARAAEITYFLHPDFCRHGLGAALLERLVEEGRQKGITTILASVSALNEGSLSFHRKHGFVECGRFKSVGRKRGRDLDVVWLQRMTGAA